MFNDTYATNYWNMIRGKSIETTVMNAYKTPDGDYAVPEKFKGSFESSLSKDNLFRRFGTIITTSSPEGRILVTESTGEAMWVEEGSFLEDSPDQMIEFSADSYKLATLILLKTHFVNDYNFDIEKYLSGAFARRFGKSEEDAFINGTGINAPSGLLSQNGAELGTTAASSTDITYEDIVKLYFSLKAEHRSKAVFLMHDDTAMALRMLKDSNGQPLWNDSNNTIFGKPVITSPYMPTMASGNKAIAFGDLSFYWIIMRQPLTVKALRELYQVQGKIGFYAYERLDGKLILPEAVKVLQMP